MEARKIVQQPIPKPILQLYEKKKLGELEKNILATHLTNFRSLTDTNYSHLKLLANRALHRYKREGYDTSRYRKHYEVTIKMEESD